MSDKARIIVIFGAIAALLGGGLYYFLRIYQPNLTRKAAQAEVLAWEARWAEARACLLGAKPASSSAREALAVRELSPDPWNRGTCSKLIGKLSRGVADDTGILKVEHAWMTVDRAAAKVATAFASHVDPFGDAPERRGDSPLPAALEELDSAQADLREAAGMDPPGAAAGSTLPVAQMITLKEGGQVVTNLDAWLLPSSGGVIGFGSTHDREVEMVLVAGAPPKLLPAPSGGVRALPDSTWGAAGLQNEVVVGPIDDKGAFGTMTNIPAGDVARVLFAVGTLADGLVAYGAGGTLGLLRASAGGIKGDAPHEVSRVIYALSPAGRALLAWNTVDGAMHGFFPKGGAETKAMELGSGWAAQACVTATHGWVGEEPQFMSFDGTSATPHVLPRHELLGCTDQAALLHKVASTSYAVCSDSCRVAELRNTKSSSVATLANDKVVAVRARGDVLGLWSENAEPVFFTTPISISPRTAISDGKVVDVIGETSEGVVVARLPLR